MFSGLFFPFFFVSVFLESVGRRRRFQWWAWIRYSPFLPFQTVLIAFYILFQNLQVTIGFFHLMRLDSFKKENEVCRQTCIWKKPKITPNPKRRIKTIFNHFLNRLTRVIQEFTILMFFLNAYFTVLSKPFFYLLFSLSFSCGRIYEATESKVYSCPVSCQPTIHIVSTFRDGVHSNTPPCAQRAINYFF